MESTTSAGPCDYAPEGHYSTGTGAKIAWADGKWSPPGSTQISDCTDCPAGSYWASGVKTPCTAGKYWAAGSSAATVDCGAGYYCPQGSPDKLICPSGTYSGASDGSCTTTEAGYYSKQLAAAGDKVLCAVSNYWVAGSYGDKQEPWDNNKYADNSTPNTAVGSCGACPAGSYCLRGQDKADWPVGHYCPEADAYPIQCEKGSFRATVKATAIGDCTACTAGQVCSQTGLTAPDKACDAGFYCPAGSVFPRTTEPACTNPGCDVTSSKVLPTGKTRAIQCPAGHYCPAGSGTPTACSAGTYNSFPGMRVSTACVACTEGRYCATDGLTTTTGACTKGYYCPAGSDSATKQNAPTGGFTLDGASTYTSCLPGTYASATNSADACADCDAGSYCKGFGNTAVTTCPIGHYCPLKSNVPTPCPPGTKNALTGKAAQSDWLAWVDGEYWEGYGNSAKTGNCEAGYYCKTNSFSNRPTEDSGNYGPCPKGHYCPAKTQDPIACPAGKYIDFLGASAAGDCKSCLPGKYWAGTGNTQPDGDCDVGYYCPGGDDTNTPTTEWAAGQYCPVGSALNTKWAAGTYQAAAKQGSCDPWPAGKYWVIGTSTPADCPAGYYCPQGTKYAHQYPCPHGKYNKLTNKQAETDCLTCPAGKVCEFSGTADETATVCAAGYYCLQGSSYTIPEQSTYGGMCAPGQYCAAGSGTATPCDNGKYCEGYLRASVNGACTLGYFCKVDGAFGSKFPVIPATYADTRGGICPIGKYWVAGAQPVGCAQGYYSMSTGLGASTDWYKCPAGYFCDTVGLTDYSSKTCPAGYYCPNGSTSGTANACTAGYMCPAGSADKVICDGGTYQDQTQQSTCKTWTKGNYCPFTHGTGLTAQVTCPAGYKCPDTGMTAPAACLKGEYQSATGQEACLPCPAGKYCDRQGLSAVSGDCPQGFYCPVGSTNKHAYMCGPGFYCPAASAAAVPCEAGNYWEQSALGAVSGPCQAGYYCDETETKEKNPSGKQCPRGKYCAQGVSAPTDCPIGKYNNKLGADAAADCLECPLGKVWDELGQIEPKSNCPATKYCTSDGTQHDWDIGYFCPAGYDYKIKCQPGTYQDQTAQSTWKDCEEGNYCAANESNSMLTEKTVCPVGYYCPAKSQHYYLYYCPQGKIRTTTGATQLSNCVSCTIKKYCDRRGLGAVSGNCKDGYECSTGSIHPTGLNTQECPKNSYCVAGTKTSCAAGTYNTELASSLATDCVPCEHGKYCPNHDIGKIDCPAGKICGEGLSAVGSATDCPQGEYCPTGSFQGIQCAHGTYQDGTGQTSCKSCPVDKIWNGLKVITPAACPDYRYCPIESIRGRRCDPGQHIASTGGTTACTDWPAGSYCWPTPKAAPDNGLQGTCSAGHVCQGGSSYQKPVISLDTIVKGSVEFGLYNGPAYPGYTSTDGTTQTACAAGTWQPSSFAQSCVPCREGHYWPDTGMSTLDSHLCKEGYLCSTGQTINNVAGNICPVETYSEAGATFCQRWADGYKNPSSGGLTGQSSCQECGAGSYCYQTESGGSYTEHVTACPTNSTTCTSELLQRELKCQKGTYLDSGSCKICTATNYCRGGAIAGKWVQGYICDVDEASLISTPNPINRACPINQYCAEGASSGTTCQAGTFNGNSGGISNQNCYPCEPGYTCKADSGGVIRVEACPIGYYWTEYDISSNTQADPEPCPKYTYSSVQKLFLKEMCTYCPAGYHCDATNITNYELRKCEIGYFCLPNALNDDTTNKYKSKHQCPLGTYGASTGLTSKLSCTVCPAGSYCDPSISSTTPQTCTGGNYWPEGSELQTTWAGGYYCRTDTNFQQTQCPVNHYCESGTENPTACAAGVICPGPTNSTSPGTLAGKKWEKGYEVQRLDGVDTCVACAAGFYNTDAATSCKACTGGYMCYGKTGHDGSLTTGFGTNRQYPTDRVAHKGEICPIGHYCPEGSSAATPCPVGTYNEEKGKSSVDDCLVCKADTYNDLTGQSGCQPCGQYAYSNTGATTCQCYGANRIFGKSDSSCRCMPRYVYRKADGSIEKDNISKEDCIHLVFGLCNQNYEGRHHKTGKCLPNKPSSCETECGVDPLAHFDKATGFCTCSTTSPTCDTTWNQECRTQADSVKINTSGQLTYNTYGNAAGVVDTSGDSDITGSYSCSNEDGCNAHSIQHDNGKVGGYYGSSAKLRAVVAAGIRRSLNKTLPPGTYVDLNGKSYYEFTKRRELLVDANSAAVTDPVVCIPNGDTVQWSITNYANYPVYDVNNILNTNNNFDSGPFAALETEIDARVAAGQTGALNPIIFSNTFSTGGTYVFNDKTLTTSQMVLVVANSGETCPSTSANIESATSRNLAAAGGSSSEDIILELDTPLLIAICVGLVLLIGITMVSVAYCLHRAWDVKATKVEGYRQQQLDKTLDFELLGDRDAPESINHDKVIDFPVEPEDNMEDINFNIHADIIEEAKRFLDMYDQTALQLESERLARQRNLQSLITEIDAMMKIAGDSAIRGDMYYGSAKDREKILKDLNKEEDQHKSKKISLGDPEEDERLKQLNDDLLRREDELKKMVIGDDDKARDERLKREILEEMNIEPDEGDDMNQPLSLKDKMMERIENDGNLERLDKDKMLFDHDKKLEGIEGELDKERQRQEYELAQLLRERAEKRRKKLAQKGGNVKKQELDKVHNEFEDKLKDELDNLNKELNEKRLEIENDPNGKGKLDRLAALEREREDQKKLLEQKIDDERHDAAKKALRNLERGDEMDENDIRSLIDKFIPHEKLNEIDEDFRNQKDQINEQKEEELEEMKRRQDEELDALENQIRSGDVDIDSGQFVGDMVDQRLLDQYYEADEDDKLANEKRKNELRELLKNLDGDLEKEALIDSWKDRDDEMERVMRADKRRQDDRIKAKLANRKKDRNGKKLEALKLKHEEEEARLILQQLNFEHLKKGDINKDQIKEIVSLLVKELQRRQESGEEDPELSLKRVKQLFESMFGEVEMTDFTNLMVKQFAEKEILLKQCLAKYVDIKRMEKSSIKKVYADKLEELESMRDQIGEEQYEKMFKDYKIREENSLREMDLKLDKLHKEEEAALLQNLEKRHAREQVQLKNDLLEEKIKAYDEIFGHSRNHNRKWII
jgi:hypothetical protein